MANENILASPDGAVGGRDPRFVPKTAYHSGFNVNRRQGAAKTRPGQFERELSFDSDLIRDKFEFGKFQGAITYETSKATFIACVVDGEIFLIDAGTGKVFYVSGLVGRNSKQIPKAFFVQANQFMIIQDGVNPAVIIDGASARRAVPSEEEIPIGTNMAFGQNRLFVNVSVEPNNQFAAGDISEPNNIDNILNFTESVFLADGGNLIVPATLGAITAMTFLPVQDSSTGLGQLLTFTEKGVFGWDVAQARSTWGDVQIGRQLVIGTGTIAPQSIVNIGNDIFFRSEDSLSSLKQERTEFAQFGVVDFSKDMKDFFELDTQWLLNFSSACYFDERLFLTTVPQRRIIGGETNPAVDVEHKGMMVLDFNGTNGLTERTLPVWEGVWEGANILQILTARYLNEDKMFIFSKDRTEQNRLFEQSKSRKFDSTLKTKAIPTTSRVYFPGLDFGNATERKQLTKSRFWIKDVSGEFSVTAYFRADNHPEWSVWGKEFKGCALDKRCHPNTKCGDVSVRQPYLQPQNRSRINLGTASSTEQKITDRGLLSQGEVFQPRFDWSGYLTLDRFTIEAEPDTRVSDAIFDVEEKCTELALCPVDDFNLGIPDHA